MKSGFRRAEGTFPAAPLPSLRFRLRHRTTKGCPCPEASTSDSACINASKFVSKLVLTNNQPDHTRLHRFIFKVNVHK